LANKAKRRDIQVMRGGVKSCRRGGYSRGRGRNQRGRGRSDFDRIEKLTDVSLLQTSQLSFALEKSLKLNPIDFTGSCKERGQWPICFNYLKGPLSILYFMYHCLKER
jgi:hypothetical protein